VGVLNGKILMFNLKKNNGIKYHFFRGGINGDPWDKRLERQIYNLTIKSWGDFGRTFINKHVLESEYLLVSFKDADLVGYASVEVLELSQKKYYYFEFLVVDPAYQGVGLSKEILKRLLLRVMMENIFNLRLYFNIVTITPNPRVVSLISRLSDWMCPDVGFYNKNGFLLPADDAIWELAQNILQSSHDPSRELDRVGLVLHNSYRFLRNLIYRKEAVPWDRDRAINSFCADYLHYEKENGDEFLVFASLSLKKIINFFVSRS